MTKQIGIFVDCRRAGLFPGGCGDLARRDRKLGNLVTDTVHVGLLAFENGKALDPCFTADEEDAVAPPLEWSAPPPGSQEIVILVEDADTNGDNLTCHWSVWGLPGQKGMLLEGETPPRVGKNSKRNSEWQLPAPPEDDAPHQYVFQIFALDLPLTLMPGASSAELVKSMEGHVVAAAVLTGTYKREEGDDEEWDEDDDFE